METLTSCPVCGDIHLSHFKTVCDYTVSQKDFHIQQCDSCSFLLTNPRPGEEEIGLYYQSQDYISHHDEASDLMSKVYKSVRDYTLRQKVEMINNLQRRKGRLLDMGCGTGNFAAAMRQNQWEVYGTEPDPEARKIASGRANATVVESIHDPALQDKTFHVISLWHVLEHIHQLNESIQWINAHLASDGHLIIAVPNPESKDAARFDVHWAAYDVPRHLYHFTKNTMDRLLSKHGFAIKEIRPMWFDSFYVSMLSSKYKNGKTGLVESFMAGALSNWQGRPSRGSAVNTSSLIYIARKN